MADIFQPIAHERALFEEFKITIGKQVPELIERAKSSIKTTAFVIFANGEFGMIVVFSKQERTAYIYVFRDGAMHSVCPYPRRGTYGLNLDTLVIDYNSFVAAIANSKPEKMSLLDYQIAHHE